MLLAGKSAIAQEVFRIVQLCPLNPAGSTGSQTTLPLTQISPCQPSISPLGESGDSWLGLSFFPEMTTE